MTKMLSMLATAVLAAGCCSSAGGARPSPTRFVSAVSNPWFPLRPGTTHIYTGMKDGQPGRDVFTITGAKRTIAGVRCTVILDRLYKRGVLAERTTDWYAQDTAGNVWYFGEATAELDVHGNVTSTEGTWQAGVDGARAGIYMPADPRPGRSGLQEFYKGHAEDHFQVLSLSARVHTPAASSSRALLTKEWTPLEPAVLDHKLYVRGIGNVREETLTGGRERWVLASVTRR